MEQSLEKILERFRESNQIPKLSPREVLDSYRHIELTEDELIEATIWAKMKKEEKLKEEERKKRENENRVLFVERKWDSGTTKSFMMYRAATLPIFKGKFKLDESNDLVFKLLTYYFSSDIEFIALSNSIGIKNPSLDKGIMLAGNFGVGKTWMMQLFQKNQRQCFNVRSAKYIADTFEREGEDSFYEFINPIKNPFNDMDSFLQTNSGLCVDDIGTEDIKNHFGNKKNVIGDLIELRYSRRTTGVMFHGTTNLTVEQLSEFYGGRVVSRMREIFNFIELPGKDRRV